MNTHPGEPEFVHLRNHSDYSIQQGSTRCQQLVEFASSQPIQAVGLTDNNNLFASVKFYKEALKGKVKPVFGIDARVMGTAGNQPYIWTLLAMNQTGFTNLKKISTRIYTHSERKNNIYIDKQYIFDHNEGLIVFSGGVDGEIGHHLVRGNVAIARVELEQWLQHFDSRFYLELQRIGRDYEEQYIADALVLAEMFNCPVIATNNTCFPTADDFESHEVRVCIAQGVLLTDTSRKVEHTREQYLKSSEQMVSLFADIPEAIANTLEVARRCTVEIALGEAHLPTYELGEGKTFDAELKGLSINGLKQKVLDKADISEEHKEVYQQRLQKELGVITQTGFSAYFLIVHEFIQWSHSQEIPVGPGRGSAAGSLVAYCLGITAVDPIRYDLLFERFLNTDRISMPDMDIDFSVAGRDRVIEHVTEKYGQNAVSQIITFGTLAARNVIRDTCRVLGHGYGLGDYLAKLLPETPGITLEEGIKQSEELKHKIETDEKVSEIIEMSSKLEGIVRHIGTHPAGVVIAPSDLLNYTPMYHDPISQVTVTQLDKNDIESVGLVKFDFLGLKTLTIIEATTKSIQQNHKIPIDITKVPFDDQQVYEMLKRGDTDSVFQLESPGMRATLYKLAPTRLEEIIAMLALYRPGPMQFIDEFIDRKFGRVEVTYPHPVLEPILADTYGIAVYQEQVMRIAQDLAGYSLGGADLLRRAMGKKELAVMAQQKQQFVQGAVNKGTDEQVAVEVFSFIEKFAEYGFNKSHSAAYAVLSYQTAWLKVHYPVDFFTAVMNNDLNSHNKLYQSYRNCIRLGVDVEPPHINAGEYEFTISKDNRIIYGLGGIKGIGTKAIETFCEERKLAPYRNMFDFCQRIDRKYVDVNVLEALICSGSFDGFGPTRSEMFSMMEQALQLSEQTRDNWRRGTNDIFGGVSDRDLDDLYTRNSKSTIWSREEILEKERYYLGFYISDHPVNLWRDDIDAITTHRLGSFSSSGEPPAYADKVIVAGALIHVKRYLDDRRETRYFFTIDDGEGIANFVCDQQQRPSDEVFSKGKVVALILERAPAGQNGKRLPRAQLTMILPIEEARYSFAKGLRIALSNNPTQSAIANLRNLLAQHLTPEGKPVLIQLITNGVKTELRLGEHWQLEATKDFLKEFYQSCPNCTVTPVH